MKETFTETKEVTGVVYAANQEYYVIGVSQICDNDGVDLPAIGWLATSFTPINYEVILLEPDTTAVYDLPVLIIGGTYISGLKNVPTTIQVLKEFSWDNVDSPDELFLEYMLINMAEELNALDKSYETLLDTVNTISEEN
jgi:hypothetical protein